MNSNEKKVSQLGMPLGTASAKLRKTIIFDLLKQLNKNYCFQCGAEIDDISHLSIEHKIPYLDSTDPKKLFFNLDNIAFSHLNCNIRASRQRVPTHGLYATYNKGCRCEPCTIANRERKRIQRHRAMV